MPRPNCKLVSRRSYDPSKHIHHVSSYSESVPDQNYSIRDLLTRFRRDNLPASIVRDVSFEEEVDENIIRTNGENFESENFEARDLTDIDSARAEIEAIKETENALRMARARRRERKGSETSSESGGNSEKSSASGDDGKSSKE